MLTKMRSVVDYVKNRGVRVNVVNSFRSCFTKFIYVDEMIFTTQRTFRANNRLEKPKLLISYTLAGVTACVGILLGPPSVVLMPLAAADSVHLSKFQPSHSISTSFGIKTTRTSPAFTVGI